MAGFIARQPNGLICRHSTVCDCITDYNMTEEEYIRYCEKERNIAREDSLDTIENYMRDFSEVTEWYHPNNLSVKQIFEDTGRNEAAKRTMQAHTDSLRRKGRSRRTEKVERKNIHQKLLTIYLRKYIIKTVKETNALTNRQGKGEKHGRYDR